MYVRSKGVLAACIASALLSAATPARAQQSNITPAPAFTATELTALPQQNWITNGGNLYNQRYSQLDQINRDNVADLKAVWRVSLGGSGMGPGYSAEAQPIVHAGIIYLVTGDNDVFAIDVDTGGIQWDYRANLDHDAIIVCCGRLSRGLGIGDGKLFLGRLDTRLQALDQETGAVLWDTRIGNPAAGESITAAPLYYDGLVIIGIAGGEYGVRGRISAYDAGTGTHVWTFHTIPGPGEFGHDTWPQDSDAWKYGGAPVWQTPSLDPDLGLLYFSTGNPGPDYNGAIRAGDNLFSVSMVALDVRTGAYRWHFQQVRHDIWDYDSPNPTILFDAVIDGVPRQGIAGASKSGYLYILDRTNGKPLTPVVDMPVPQNPLQVTAATQPIPLGDPVVPHAIDAVGENYVGLLPNRGRTFTPFGGDQAGNWKPSSGVNWQPSSFNVESNLMYLCASDSVGGGSGGDPNMPVGPERPGAGYSGRGTAAMRQDVGVPRRDLLVAMNLTNHEVAWRRLLNARCAGSITTAGGLIFTGRYNGELTAMHSGTGQRLWAFQTDGGLTTTASTFEHAGEQYLVIIAGGAVFGGRQNDGVWLFSLNGTIEPLPPGSGDPEPGTGRGGPGRGRDAGIAEFAAPQALGTADLERGAAIYRTVCQICHGENGEGGHELGAPLSPALTLQTIVEVASAGVPGTNMAPFGASYSAQELRDVAAYITEEMLR